MLPSLVRPLLFMLDPRISLSIGKVKAKLFGGTAKEQQNTTGDALTELTNTVRASHIYSCLAGILLMNKSQQTESMNETSYSISGSDYSGDFNEEILGR
jgi:hypothetical protein